MLQPMASCGGVNGSLAPPLRFRPAGDVKSAWPCDSGPFANVQKLSGTPAQKAGKRYEKRVLAKLSALFGSGFRPSQWFRFVSQDGIRYCQVDGLLHREGLTAIFEVKYSFTADAWWQLRKLYQPVVQRAYHPNKLALVLITRYFDSAIAFPEELLLLPELTTSWAGDCHSINLLTWRF